MRKKTFLINSIVLTVTTLVSRIIGILFRVYMSNKVGAEAIGLYQLILTIYFFAATLTSSGFSLAVTRLVTDALAKGNKNQVVKIVRISFVLSLTLGICLCLFLIFGADFIGNTIIGDERSILTLKILGPSLPFMAISSCCRGYFFAVRKVLKTASEQVLEQVLEIIVFSLLIGFMLPKGIGYACAAVVIGTTVAEVVSFAYSYILYRIDVKKFKSKSSSGNKGIICKMIKISSPVTGSACLRSGLSMVENIMIPKRLSKSGASYEIALSGYGMLTGMVMPVITFPSAFLMSFSMLLIPEISEANTIGRKKNIKYMSGRVFQITFFFSILVTGIFIFFGKDLSLIIYNDVVPGIYISVLAPILPLMYLDSVVDGMLKGLNEQVSYLTYNLIDSIMRVTLTYFLLPIFGLNGVIIVIFASEILNSTLSIAKLMKVTKLKMEFMRWIVKPIISIAMPGLFIYIFNEYITNVIQDVVFRFIVEISVTIIFYIVFLILLKAIEKEDIIWLKSIAGSFKGDKL